MTLLPLLELAAATDRPRTGGGIAVVEVSMSAGQMTPLHAHAEDEAVSVMAGAVTVHLDGEAVELRAGDSYVVPSGAAHSLHAHAGAVRYLVAAAARTLGRYEDFVRAVSLPGDLGSSGAGLHALASAIGTVVLGAPGELPARAAAPAA